MNVPKSNWIINITPKKFIAVKEPFRRRKKASQIKKIDAIVKLNVPIKL